MNVKLTWKDPTTRADGTALAAADIKYVSVFIAVTGDPSFSEVAQVPAGVQEFVQTDLPAGSYDFRLVVVDTQRVPQSSAGVLVTVDVQEPLKAAPSDVTEVVTLVE